MVCAVITDSSTHSNMEEHLPLFKHMVVVTSLHQGKASSSLIFTRTIDMISLVRYEQLADVYLSLGIS